MTDADVSRPEPPSTFSLVLNVWPALHLAGGAALALALAKSSLATKNGLPERSRSHETESALGGGDRRSSSRKSSAARRVLPRPGGLVTTTAPATPSTSARA